MFWTSFGIFGKFTSTVYNDITRNTLLGKNNKGLS